MSCQDFLVDDSFKVLVCPFLLWMELLLIVVMLHVDLLNCEIPIICVFVKIREWKGFAFKQPWIPKSVETFLFTLFVMVVPLVCRVEGGLELVDIDGLHNLIYPPDLFPWLWFPK